jgi:glycosyltransferase involved in cell wall biosynthesis
VNGTFITAAVRFLYEVLQKYANNASDMTVFQNHVDATQFFNRGLVKANKMCVILGSGVRTDLFSRSAVQKRDIQAVRKELGLQDGNVVITMVSRLIRSKGVLDFQKAAKIIADQHDSAKFILIGPEDRDSIDRLSSREISQVSKTVKWLGERHDLAAILAVSDVFVLPSFYREGIPRVLLEAASMGLPLVTTQSPGCVEVVQEGVNGFLVPPRDPSALAKAIEALVQDSSLRKVFGQASRQLALKRFDLSVIARATATLYRRLLAQQ